MLEECRELRQEVPRLARGEVDFAPILRALQAYMSRCLWGLSGPEADRRGAGSRSPAFIRHMCSKW